MELPKPAARYLGEPDRGLLAAFRCSTGPWYEDDVERFVNSRLVDRHKERREHTDHRVIGLELPDRGLIAVGAHEEDLIRDGEVEVTSTLLEVGAVAVEFQGATLADVEPLDPDRRPVSVGRWLMEVILGDVAETRRDPIIRGIVARENARSLALCRRVGLVHERDDADSRFIQLWGRY
jgi:hypothetical protein